MKGASLSRIWAEMLMGDEPAAIDPAQNGGAASAAGGFLAADEAFPAEFVVAGGHFIGDNGPCDVVEAEHFVLDQLERLLESGLGGRFTDKRVLGEKEHGILGDAGGDLFPGVRVEFFDVGRERGFVVHGGIGS